jgi:hypothetical protein
MKEGNPGAHNHTRPGQDEEHFAAYLHDDWRLPIEVQQRKDGYLLAVNPAYPLSLLMLRKDEHSRGGPDMPFFLS